MSEQSQEGTASRETPHLNYQDFARCPACETWLYRFLGFWICPDCRGVWGQQRLEIIRLWDKDAVH